MDSLMTLQTTIPDIPANQLIKKLLIYGGILLIIAYALFLRFRRWQLMLQAHMQRSESLNHLLDKFGNAREFLDFLQTDSGQRLLDDPLSRLSDPFTRVVRFAAWGISLLMVGVVLLLSVQAGLMRIPALLLTSLGAGLLVVALVTYVLFRRWDMLPHHPTTKNGAGM
jgi:hypothetical protein